MSDDLLKQIIKGQQERKAQLDVLEEQHKQQTEKLKEEIQMLEAAAHKLLVKAGLQSVRTPEGTAYRQKWSKGKVTDWDQCWSWAVKNDRKDLISKAINKTVLIAEIDRAKEAQGEDYKGCPIPGVELEEGYKCTIRKT